MTELALLMPLFIAVVVGVVDLGRLMHDVVSVEGAANAGAQYAASHPSRARDRTGIHAAVYTALGDNLQGEDATVTDETFCECDNGTRVNCDTGKCSILPLAPPPPMYVSVTVHKTFEPIIDYPGLPDQFRLDRKVERRAR